MAMSVVNQNYHSSDFIPILNFITFPFLCCFCIYHNSPDNCNVNMMTTLCYLACAYIAMNLLFIAFDILLTEMIFSRSDLSPTCQANSLYLNCFVECGDPDYILLNNKTASLGSGAG